MQWSAQKLALYSLLVALLVVGRLSFQFLPNVQPNTALLIIMAIVLGIRAGALFALMSMFLTNLVLGMGSYFFMQLFMYTLICIMSGLLGKVRGRWPKTVFILAAIFSVISGYLYGFGFAVQNWVVTNMFWAYWVAGWSFDTVHALSNIFFFLILYKPITHLLERYSPLMANHKRT
ncbi:ECF transporter S component [Bacillus fonticola]|uniref:ECF transporter S component n=1 Tax=Bacillus fonticola TaxID=2728853 RepID=UPI0014728DDF|nr:ECF transporter S component [Bacillus fonticola]